MNTLCIDSNGNYIDNLNAIKDIENKIINTVGKSDKKIKEDALRILRAIRFATTLNFRLSDELEQAIKKNKKNLKKLSYDRKKHELDLIFSHPNVLYGISLLKKLELMQFLDLKDTNIIKTSRIGVWFQLDDKLKYPYTTQEKNHLLKINKLMLQNLDDKYVLYQNDIEDIKIAAILKNQNLDDVLTKYNELIIKNIKEIKIDSYKICDILGCEKRTKLKEIYTDLEKKILYKELINDEVKIKQYLIKEYLN